MEMENVLWRQTQDTDESFQGEKAGLTDMKPPVTTCGPMGSVHNMGL